MNPSYSTVIPKKELGELLGLDALDQAERDQMLEGIGELIMESVIMRAVADMTDEEAEAFAAEITKCADPEMLIEVLAARVPTIDDLIREESEAFRTACTDLMTQAAA